MNRIRTLLRISRPLYLLLAALTYTLGAGIARYVGKSQGQSVFWFGLLAILMAQLSMNLLVEVFRPFNEPIEPDETRIERKAVQDASLYLALVALTAAGVIAFFFFRDHNLSVTTMLFLGLSLLVAVMYAVPPLRLVAKGFGEFLLAFQLAYLVPSIGFLLQAANYQRLLSVVVIPLSVLTFAALIAFDFPDYSDDVKYERGTLLTRLGWERAVPLHHALIVAAYFLFAAAPLSGFSYNLLWPAFLSLPFAILQVYLLHNIALGAKPVWNLLIANAIALIGLTSYFLTLTFWLH
jgi:1,4-dihydroxy-2-naphthoate octaprenyltransferase